MRYLLRVLRVADRPSASAAHAVAGWVVAGGCIALGACGVLRAADDDPRSWLARTDQALSKRNYEGVFVHEHGSDSETLRVIHRVGSDGVSERLLSMDGSGREFIRRGSQLTCYLPDKRTVLVEKSQESGLLLASLPRLDVDTAARYQITELARTRASGRPVRVIAITPTDEMRYGYRVWIDEASAMPLKTQLRNRSGDVLEQLVFTDLRLPSHIPDAELQPSVDARTFRWIHQDTQSDDPGALAVSWQAGVLPAGFRLINSARQMLPGGPVEHLVFSDGMASVSVFVEVGREPGGGGHDDAATLGTSAAYATMVEGYRVTAVGEVPPETVRAIAQSIRTAGPVPAARSGEQSDTYAAMEHPLAPALRTRNSSSIFDPAPRDRSPDISTENQGVSARSTFPEGLAVSSFGPASPPAPAQDPAAHAPGFAGGGFGVGFGPSPGAAGHGRR